MANMTNMPPITTNLAVTNIGRWAIVMRKRSILRRMVVTLSVLYAAVFIFMIIVKPGTEQFYTDFHNTYQILPALFATVCGIAYARKAEQRKQPKTDQLGWLLIGLGALSFAFGQSTWTFYESVLRLEELPFPGLADVGYLGAYPLLIAGVVLLFGSMPVVGRLRLLLDSALAASAIAMLSWYFLVSELWHTEEVALLGKVISVAYPLGDVAVLFCAIVLFKGSATQQGLRRSLAFLACGIGLLAFADTAFTYYNLHNAYATGSWFDWGWSFGWLLIGYASLLPLWWPHSEEQAGSEISLQHQTARGSALLVTLAPYLAVGISFAVVVWYDMSEGYIIHLNVLLIGSVLIMLVILRQILALLENQHLTSELRSFNTNLENMVVRRTEQLTALLQLTKAINTTLKADQVIDAALQSTQQALQADAVMIRIVKDGVLEKSVLPPIAKQIGLDGQPHVVQFIEQLPINNHTEAIPLPADPYAMQQSGGNYLRAPLLWQRRTIGIIGVVRWKNSFSPTELEMLESIGVEVGSAMENARLYATAVEAADQDPVTGLYNHRAIHQRLDAVFIQAAHDNSPLTVIMMDLNNFKRFNDTYGHPIGDQVLKRVAHVLSSRCRSGDILGRYGGDEFVVVLPETDARTAYKIAERFRDAMAEEGFQRSGERNIIPVTCSFGLATFPIDSHNRHDLLAIADANLYAAKQSEEGIRGTTESQRTNLKLRAEGTFEVLDALVAAVDNKDRYTRQHSEDVTDYALWIAEEMGLSEETQRVLRMGCLLHDVGKIGVPDDILRKPGRLTAEEYEVMKQHPHLGALIVGALPGMEYILDIVRSHHERWDGRGYPDGLKGEEISLLGRLVAVADAFSAMTTDRPYRKGLDWLTALEEIRTHMGTQFDPMMAQHFINAVTKRMSTTAALATEAPTPVYSPNGHAKVF
jgi:diguanylate cyclase (GGDEF)-like protein/putative nucleotidyltransferase with HDIG domain